MSRMRASRVRSVAARKQISRRNMLLERLEDRVVLTAQSGLSQFLPALPDGPPTALINSPLPWGPIRPVSIVALSQLDSNSAADSSLFAGVATAYPAGGNFGSNGPLSTSGNKPLEVVPGHWITRFDGIHGSADEQVAVVEDWIASFGLAGIEVSEALGLPGMVTIETAADMPYEQLSAHLAHLPGFVYVAPDYKVWGSAVYPNDPLFPQLYGLDNTGQYNLSDGTYGVPDADIDAPEAWDLTTGDSSVVVGVIDSGIDFTHPDLIDNIWTNPNEIAGNGIDDDANGFVDDVHGWDFWGTGDSYTTADDDNNPADENGHGTHVSGTIGGAGNDAVGVAGVNWDVSIMPLRFLGPGNYGWLSDAVRAINYATMMRQNGVNLKVTNNSWGWTGFEYQPVADAIAANEQAGVLFVAAAGNEATDNDASYYASYPATYASPNIISVAATDNQDNLAYYSNYGATTVDLGAPGSAVLSTVPNFVSTNGYAYYSGTSMATPHVTGVAALAWSIAPDATYQEIKDAILGGVDPLPSLNGITVTGGRLNAHNTLEQLGILVTTTDPAADSVVSSPPAQYTVHFSLPFDPVSISADDFTVNGMPAQSFFISDSHTVTFGFSAVDNPVVVDGLQTMAIAQGAVEVDPNSSSPQFPFRGFEATFRYDSVLLAVESTNPPLSGGKFTLPGPFTYMVHFNEPIDPSSLQASDLVLSGLDDATVSSVNVAADGNAATFTISGIHDEGTLAVSIPAGAITDVYGNSSAEFSASYFVDYGTAPYPVPLTPIAPLGSLIYEAVQHGIIDPDGDADRFTIDVDRGQTITVLVRSDSTLQAGVKMIGPFGVVLSSRTATAAGEDVLLQTIRVPGTLAGDELGPRTHTVEVKGVNHTTGQYSVQIFLNAALEEETHGGADNNILSAAQELTSSFVALNGLSVFGNSPQPQRIAVLGQVNGAPDETVPRALADVGTGWGNAFPLVLQPFGLTSMRYQQIYPSSEIQGGGLLDQIRLRRGEWLPSFVGFEADVTIQVGYSARGFTDASAHYADNLGTGVITVYDGPLTVESLGSGSPNLFDIIIDVDNLFAYDPSRGDLIIDFAVHNSSATLETYFSSTSPYDFSPTTRIWSESDASPDGYVNAGYGLVTQFGFVPDAVDNYSFELSSGQNATIAVTSLNGEPVQVALLDRAGKTLALGATDAADNVSSHISNFFATSTGTYYLQVSSEANVQYSLVVTRNADFDREDNDSPATAQDLISKEVSSRRWTLGYLESAVIDYSGGFSTPTDLAANGSAIFANNAAQLTDASFGVAGSVFSREAVPVNGFDTTFTFQIVPGTDPMADGITFTIQGVGSDALGVGGNGMGYYGISPSLAVKFDIFDPVPWSPVSQTGLVTDGADPQLVSIDLLPSGIDLRNQHPFQVDMHYDGTTLEVTITDTITQASATQLYTIDIPSVIDSDLAFVGFTAGTGSYSALHSIASWKYQSAVDSDFYRVTASARATLQIETTTPAFQSGEFRNRLDPALELYDAAGNLVARNDNGDVDGRNAKISYKVPVGKGGAYFIRVVPSSATLDPTSGEYILSVKGTNGTLPPFHVTSTVPENGAPVYSPPQEVTVNVSDNILLSTLQGNDLKVNGIKGAGVNPVDGDSAVFDLKPVIQWTKAAGGNGHYYVLTSGQVNWEEAEAQAAALGGHLVTINSQAENDFLQRVYFSGPARHDSFWIGLNDVNSEGTFVWSSGEPVTYTNWEPGEPNDFLSDEDYAVLNWHYAYGYPSAPGTWNDTNLDSYPADPLVGPIYGIIELTSRPSGTYPVKEGINTLAIAAGAIKDVQGTSITAYGSTFLIDQTPPRVVNSSIQQDQVLSPGNLSYTVTFSEPIQTALIDASDFILVGELRNSVSIPIRFDFDASGTILTIQYADLPDDRYSLLLLSGPDSFQDQVGLLLDGETSVAGVPRWPIGPGITGNNVEGGDFMVQFVIDAPSQALPVPLVPVAPLGSLIHQSPWPASGTIAFAGDTDDFTINLDANQTVSLVIGASAGLQPTVTLFDAANQQIGNAIVASAPGEEAIYQATPILNAGTYRVSVGSVSGLGSYAVELIVNAALEEESHGGAHNDSLPGQSLDASFLDLGNGISRGAVLGQSDGAGGYLASAESFEFIDIRATGQAVLQGSDDGSHWLSPADLNGFQFTMYGSTSDNLYVNANGSLYLPAGNSGSIYALGRDLVIFGSPTAAVYWQVLGEGVEQQLVIQWNDVGFYGYSFIDPITFQVVLSEADGSIQFNYLDLQTDVSGANEGQYSTVGISGYPNGSYSELILPTYDAPNQFVGTGRSTQIANVPASPDLYAFHLDAGQSATIGVAALTDISGLELQLRDEADNLLAISGGGTSSFDIAIVDFMAPVAGTYYAVINSQTIGEYSLVVTRNATFDTEPNNSLDSAQPVGVNQGAIGVLSDPSGVSLLNTFEGLDALGSGGYRPPDTNAAVGNNFVVETVNIQIRIFDKTTGSVLLDEPLGSFFGAFSGGDPYVVYDDIADRWYVSAFNSDNSGLFLAASNSGNPLDGFSVHTLTNVGGFPDYQKLGFNKDAVFISYNDFGGGSAQATIVSIDKAALLNGSLTYYVSVPQFQFRAMPPAQMHGDLTGGVQWFVSTNGSEIFGDAMRVTKMENYLSNTPTFTYTYLPVTPYYSASVAEQPGGYWTTFPNTTTTQVDYRDGVLVTAMSTAFADSAGYPKGAYYQIDVDGGTPILVREGRIDPGPGVAVQMPTVAQDIHGNLGFTWMQASATEYVSMYVGTVTASGGFGATVAAAGEGFFYASDRAGDYSSTVLDPVDGMTFWSANEYIGSDSSSNIWRTKIAAFQVSVTPDGDWYSVAVAEGGSLQLAIGVPAAGPGEFVNDLVPRIELYDASGTMLDSSEGVGAGLTAGPLAAGTYAVLVTSAGDAGGEYILSVSGATPVEAPFVVAATDPADGASIRGRLTDYIIHFSDLVLLTSLDAEDVSFNGLAATAVTIVDGDTAIFSVPDSLAEGWVTISIAEGSVQDIQGTDIAAFTASYYSDFTPPRVIGSSIQEGDVIAAGDLVYTVNFSEPMFPYVVPYAASIYGQFLGSYFQPVSIEFDAAGTTATITYAGLPEDAYMLVLNNWAFQDMVGFALDGEPLAWPIPPNQSGDGYEYGDFYVNFATDGVAQPLPTPLVSVNPSGSLMYQTPSDAQGVIQFAGDADDFTIEIDADQTLSLLIQPQYGWGLQATIEVYDPSNTLLATATGVYPDNAVLLQTVPVVAAGTYTVRVTGDAGTVGVYSIGLMLNAALEEEPFGGPANNDALSAQSIASSFIPLIAGADRGAVRGISGDDDVYSFSLEAGQSLAVVLDFDAPMTSFFGPRTDYSMSAPWSEALGDVNNDGHLDIVTSSGFNFYDSQFSVRLGAGDGSFDAFSSFGDAYGEYPLEITLADLNSDGNLDLVAANNQGGYYGRSVTVQLGNGDGTFQSSVGYFAGYNNFGVAVGDVTGDGSPDIITTTDNSSDNLWVLPSNGDGTFGTAAFYTVGSNPWDVALADVDGVNGLDIVTANFYGYGASVTVLLNGGSGTFGSGTSYYAGYYNSSVALGDVNGDGAPDIVTTNYYDLQASVLLNNNDGSGAFGSPAFMSVGSYYVRSVALGDVNEDGAADIVTGAEQNPTTGLGAVSVLLNDGSGGFGGLQLVDSAYATTSVALGDMNEDGHLDIAASGYYGFAVSVLLNLSSPTALTLYDPNGLEVTSSTSGTEDFDVLLAGFVASETGTYTLRVSAPAVARDYSLVVTRDTVLEVEDNDSLGTAQTLDLASGSSVVLGYVEALPIPLYAIGNDGYDLISIDPARGAGAVVGSLGVYAPSAAMTPDGTLWTVVDNTQLAIVDLDSGEVTPVGDPLQAGFGIEALEADSAGNLYGFGFGALYALDTVNGQATLIGFSGGVFNIGDLAFDNNGVLWAIGYSGDLWTIDPTSGVGIFHTYVSFDIYSYGPFGLMVDPLDGVMYATNYDYSANLYRVDPISGMSERVGPVGVPYPRGGDFFPLVTSSRDVFQFEVASAQTVIIETTTPAGGPGEFVNELDPVVRVYDAGGNLVVENDNGAADMRNAWITLEGLSAGTYFIDVTGADESIGEYVLSVRQTPSTSLEDGAGGEAVLVDASSLNADGVAQSPAAKNSRFDVSADGRVSAIDVLLIINSLNTGGSRRVSALGSDQLAQVYYDVNQDGMISPADAQTVISHLNDGLAAEGEAPLFPVSAVGIASPSVDGYTVVSPAHVAGTAAEARDVVFPTWPMGAANAPALSRTAGEPGGIWSRLDVEWEWTCDDLEDTVNLLADDQASVWTRHNG